MSIPRWNPTSEYSSQEKTLLEQLDRVRTLYRFLRKHRDVIFDEAMEDELASMYRDSGAGKDPKPPAMMAMATLLQDTQTVRTPKPSS